MVGFGLVGGAVQAAEDHPGWLSGDHLSIDNNFQGGRWEATFASGPMFSPLPTTTHNRPTIDYVVGSAQLGFMMTDPHADGILRGNLELAPEVFGAGIYQENGHYIAGSTLWLRYNFVPRESRIIPYVQVGGGLTTMDIDHKYDGQNFNFNVDAGVGARCFATQRFSVNVECRFQHISNANLGDHNIGLNALGVLLGASWFF